MLKFLKYYMKNKKVKEKKRKRKKEKTYYFDISNI